MTNNLSIHANNYTKTHTETGTGVITNTVNAPIEKLRIAGFTRPSYNILDCSLMKTGTANGITVEYDTETQELVFNGTNSGSTVWSWMPTTVNIPITAGNSYYLITEYSGTITADTANNTAVKYFLFYVKDSNGTTHAIQPQGNAPNPGTAYWDLQSASTYRYFGENISGTVIGTKKVLTGSSIVQLYMAINTGITCENFKVKIMLTDQDGLTKWEPYGKSINRDSIKISGNINLLDVPYELTFLQYTNNLSGRLNLKANTEYIFYCDEVYNSDTDDTNLEDVAIIFQGVSVKDGSTYGHNFPAKRPVRVTTTSDNPSLLFYSNGFGGAESVGVFGTIKGLRIYETKYDPTVYIHDQTVDIPYSLAEGEYIELVDGVVTLYKTDGTTDITDTETGIALKNLHSNYPATVLDDIEADIKVLG